MYCPKDLKPCCDSLCRGSLTCFDTGEAMLDLCPGGCGMLVSAEDRSDCQCEPVLDDDDEESAHWWAWQD